MEKKTIYFHIGTHKTGTTALQKFFVDNREVLEKKGFRYDFYNDSEMNQGYLVKPEKWEGLIFDENKNYIISGEDFYSHILNIPRVIKERLSDFNVNFVVYFKRQDLMKQSVYNQIVKMHGFTKEITADNHYNLNYYDFLKKLEKQFPEGKLTVRVYEKGQFEGGSIFSDFLKILNLDLTNEYQVEKKVVNPSLTTEKMEFTRYLNRLGLPIGFRTQLSRLVVKSALESNEVSLFRKQDLISPQQAKKLLAQYEPGNQAIAKEFLGREDGKLFYEEVTEDPNWKPFPGLTKEVAQTILQKMAELDKQALEQLYQLIMATSERKQEFVQSANFLMPLLIKTLNKNTEFQPFTVSSFAAAPDHTVINPFEAITKALAGSNGNADILREVALAFERSGDIQTAFKVMEQAHFLRPQGPVIKQKLEEYRALLSEKLNEKTAAAIPPEGIETINAIGHRDYVGGLWEEIGQLQFNFLVAQGLKPEHTLLDIACGSLRGGVHFINYLNPGNYLGLDKEQELINRGIEHELGKNKQAEKHPEFVISACFEFDHFSKVPDYAIAQSLFTHLVEEDIKACLKNLKAFAGDKSLTFFATFFECETPQKGELDTSHSHAKFEYTRAQMEQFGKETGWQVKYIGDWNHPRGQKMVKYFIKGQA
ncbi:class I SAM-dependent methyltransferase [Vreelandella aquamarina]|uniref:class I SAM-dependent methyltransferase n=1 Tax=Vreelandella aquamarina TaxID=77097 RepID=UPI001D18604E|nr:class I SAM-dependent methyltransferase [Halomonas meridiana]MCC4288864.1 class I SAM-dependent methyltransferase [Halomonas meridiana]